MCGIYGRVSFGGAVDVADCLRRTRILSHRGPDYCGYYANANVFLGHTRLSILDLTSAGNQPFGDADAQLIFNGEIYNYKQLRDEYLAGQELHSYSDTEVLFLLLRKLSQACLPLLNGMFAFAYYLPAARKLLLVRDLLGIKPLYFIAAPTHFEFSSEIKNLDYVPDLNRLKEYFVFNQFGEDSLPFANVHELLPGNYVELDCATGRWVQQPYREVESLVSPEYYQALGAQTDLSDKLDCLLQRSIALHEQSDAPIGFLCSGGLDSSLITAMAGRHHPNITLYHADFEGEGRELHFAEQVARHIGAPLMRTTITNQQFWEMFPEVTYAHDLPVQHPHSVSLCLIAQRAKTDGLKVLLTGEGADELFAGYWFYPAYQRSLSLLRNRFHPDRWIGRFLRSAVGWLGSGADPYFFFNYICPGFQQHAHVGFGDAWSLGETIQSLGLVGHDFSSWSRWQKSVGVYSWMEDRREALQQSFQLFYLRYHLQPLLHRLDRMLMIHSIEGRVPFLENQLIQFGVNLAWNKKVKKANTKLLLKQVASCYLPEAVVSRKKVGFSVPWQTYARGFPKILEKGFVAEWTRLTKPMLVAWINGNTSLLYRLISLEVWGRIFVHKTPWHQIRLDV